MAETILLEIVTPVRLMRAQEVHLAVLPGEGGNLGVLPQHAPLLSSLRPGTIDIHDDRMKVVDQIFVEQGFVDVTPERCTVLAEEAIPVSDIGRDYAEERLKRATDALMIAETFGARQGAERELRVAEAMVAAVDAYHKRRQE
ncbi:MAG: ATP synthase F1 subunit epsilon [Rhodospirillales bacterium]|nr:MAG: ATP synthase F1 subunit epsilon [Rhodospirillales bacterium]